MTGSGSGDRRRADLVVLAAGAAAAAAYGALALLSRRPAHVPLASYFAIMGIGWAALLVAHTARRRPPHRADVYLWAFAFRLIGLLGDPVLEDDHYRYLWDGRTFALAGNPYGRPPADSFLDESVPPRFHEILDRINHPDLPTIYGPVAEVLFLVGYWVSPGSLAPLKEMLVACDVAIILLLLRLAGPRPALFYAWCPLAIQETAFNGHVDSLGVALALGAFLAAARQRRFPAMALLAAATAARPFALLLVPFLAGRRVLAWLVFAGVLAAIYLPFIVPGGAAGGAVLALFARDWEFNSFVHGALASLLGAWPSRITCGILFAAGYAVVLWRYASAAPRSLPRGDLLFALFFVLSPVVNPWYLLWMAPFVAVRPSGWGVGALLAVSLTYAHGGFLATPGLAPYAHPAWVRPAELLIVAGGLLVEQRIRRRSHTEGDRH